jgi:hypothetical protein
MAEGKSPDTPAACHALGHHPKQEVVSGTLADLPGTGGKGRAQRLRPSPSWARWLGCRKELAWFDGLPLFGKSVLVTRTRQQAGRLSRLLAAKGAERAGGTHHRHRSAVRPRPPGAGGAPTSAATTGCSSPAPTGWSAIFRGPGGERARICRALGIRAQAGRHRPGHGRGREPSAGVKVDVVARKLCGRGPVGGAGRGVTWTEPSGCSCLARPKKPVRGAARDPSGLARRPGGGGAGLRDRGARRARPRRSKQALAAGLGRGDLLGQLHGDQFPWRFWIKRDRKAAPGAGAANPAKWPSRPASAPSPRETAQRGRALIGASGCRRPIPLTALVEALASHICPGSAKA